MIATLVDTDALWHAALYAFLGSTIFVAAFGLAVFAHDRAARAEGVRARVLAWNTALCVGLICCVGVLGLGVWAMTQKPS
jgi:hypothetical protein